MRTLKFFLPALFVMLFAASVPALAQQGARRNNSVTSRQETKAQAKQNKVDAAQKPASVAAQPQTDQRMRTAGGSQGDRRNGRNTSGSSGSNRPPAGSGYGSHSGSDRPSAGGGYSYGGNRPPAGSVPPPPPPAGNYPGGYNYPGVRPPLPSIRTYDRSESIYRTNCSTIVLRTPFRTKEDAYRYVERLLVENDYSIGTYGNGYNWLQSDIAFIPTPFDWTNPMTHNQFRIKVNFVRYFGYVRVTLSGEWRESVLSSIFSTLRFQPSSSYSTYYAWNVLEDLADAIPHTAISYR